MKHIQMKSAVLAAIAIFASPAVLAEFYVGGAIGQARINEGIDGFRIEDNTTTWRIYAGYEFNDYIGLEGSYLDLGEFSDTVVGIPVRADADGWSLAAVGKIPLSEKWAIQAKAGLYFWDGQSSVDGIVEQDPGDQNPFVGLGVAYKFNNKTQLDVGVDYYDMDDVQPLVGSIGLSFRF